MIDSIVARSSDPHPHPGKVWSQRLDDRAANAGEAAREGAVKALVDKGLGVHRVVEAGGGLESVFLKLTRAGVTAEGGEA